MPDVMRTPITSPTRWVADPPSLPHRTALCAAAETVGMAASSAAARIADTAVGGGPLTTSVALAALAVIVAGGLIEGWHWVSRRPAAWRRGSAAGVGTGSW